MLGVLVKGSLDDGRGKARVHLFRHKHEMESGRTSSVGMEIMGYDSRGEVIASNVPGRKLTWEEIGSRSVSRFFDPCRPRNHRRLTKNDQGQGDQFHRLGRARALPPHHGVRVTEQPKLLLVDGRGEQWGDWHEQVRETWDAVCLAGSSSLLHKREHLGIALALNIPVMVVVTKIDICPPHILQQTIKQLMMILKSPGARKIPTLVKTKEECINAAVRIMIQGVGGIV